MKVSIQWKKSMVVCVSMLLVFTLFLSTAYAEKESTQAMAATRALPEISSHIKAEDAEKYLQHFYGISFSEERVSPAEFENALATLGKPVEIDWEEEEILTLEKAAVAVIKAAGMKELALTYSEEKILASLEGYHETEIGEEAAAYVACGLDIGLIPSTLEMKAPLDPKAANYLLMNVIDVTGKGRQYIGWTGDPKIYGKIMAAWNSFTLFEEETLDAVGVGVIKEGATTGYLLTYQGNESRFIPEYSLQYDHSDIRHALQLVGLLASEGIQARVQLEPKTSVYEYMLEWGPISEPTPRYAVVQVSDDLYLAHTVGYILSLEFVSEEDKEDFDRVIEAYAKKYEGNEEAVGLIAGSYWQPLYSSKTEMPEPAYVEMRDVSLSHNGYQLNSLTLTENAPLVIETMESMTDLDIEKEKAWSNAAFYRYLTGSDFQ